MDFEQYSKDNKNPLQVNEGYSEWSLTYDSDGGFDGFDVDLLEQIDLDWSGFDRALDIACGTGRIGEWLKEKKLKNIDGVDLSAEMLEQANKKNIYNSLFLQDFLDTSIDDNCYDLVISSLAVGHIENIDLFYKNISKILKPEGIAVVIGIHPHLQLHGCSTSFINSAGTKKRIRNYIHLM